MGSIKLLNIDKILERISLFYYPKNLPVRATLRQQLLVKPVCGRPIV